MGLLKNSMSPLEFNICVYLDLRVFYFYQKIKHFKYIQEYMRGTWVAQSLACTILDFGSGHDLTVVRLSPSWGSRLGMEPACLPLPASLPPPPPRPEKK